MLPRDDQMNTITFILVKDRALSEQKMDNLVTEDVIMKEFYKMKEQQNK